MTILPTTLSSFNVIALPMACIVSYLFYMGIRSGANVEIRVSLRQKTKSSSSSHLRQDSERAPSFESLFEDDYSDEEEFIGIDDGIPRCARDIFFPLHKTEGMKSNCRGMLIRDDILLTSQECSRSNHTFHFFGLGVLEAYPHTKLNSKMGGSSSLGFLKANPPYHYHFIDKPVRRTRMFLSLQSNTIVNGATAVMTCDEYKPIAHNFPVDGELIPLGQLLGILPEDVLWEHTDIYTAPMLKYKKERWWARAIRREEDEKVLERYIEQYKGPPGSVSIPDAHDGFVSQASAVCEAVDPRGHRRGDCMRNYFPRWQDEEPFSGQHFFDWLDFGGGKFLLEKNFISHKLEPMHKDYNCYKRDFNSKTVHYFNEKEQRFHEVYIEPSEDGQELIARYLNGELVPESSMEDPHLYMWGLDGKFYIVDNRWNKERFNAVKHTGVMNGMPALSGGKMYFGKNGSIWGINYSSGHYRPGIESLGMMYQHFKDQNFNLTALHWVGRMQWSRLDCYMADWDSIEIPGYEPSELKQSCLEATTSPTWILKEDV